jgi:tRNA(fMet)-specific endonuclease VapC
MQEFLRRVEVLPWDSTAADRYGFVRADIEKRGQTLAPLDLLIAAHALSIGAVLVTNDRVFHQVPHLDIEDWTVLNNSQ